MFRIVKFLPLLVVMAGGGYVAQNFDEFMARVTNKAKVLLTGMELGRIRDELKVAARLDGKIPGKDDAQDFGEFLRASFKPYFGSRDPATDLWDNDFQMNEAEEEDYYLVFSTGPNGHIDDCMLLDGEKAVEEIAQDLVDTKVASVGGQPTAGDGKSPPPLSNDDICIAVELSISEGPFRQLD